VLTLKKQHLAYASPIKDSEMLKHHRGMQSINHTKCTKVSTYTIAIKRHRGMNSIKICDNILIRKKWVKMHRDVAVSRKFSYVAQKHSRHF
jgi:hypothetical protein